MNEVAIPRTDGGFEVRIPPICPCCLHSVSDPKDTKSFCALVSDEGWRTNTLHLSFPYCRSCIRHVDWFDRGAMPGFVRRGILAGILPFPLGVVLCGAVAEIAFSYLGIRSAASWLAVVTGILVVSPILWYYLRTKLRSDRPASLDGHAAKEWAVHMRFDMMRHLEFSFDHVEYAKVFWEANREQAYGACPRSSSEVED